MYVCYLNALKLQLPMQSVQIRVITKLPNSEQSSKGKVKAHNYINRQISQQPENWENRNDPDLVQAFNVMSWNPAHGEVYSKQHYVTQFIRDL
jgi:hypothetical protein